MKFNYKLRRLCGAYYGHPLSTSNISVGNQWSGSNVLYDSAGNQLISAVSNRIQVVDLKSNTVRTIAVEARSNIRCMALSPDDSLLITVDTQNYVMLVNMARGIVLHRMKFKHKARDIQFSPDGEYIAVTQGKHVQVWCTPRFKLRKEFAPLVLHRTYSGQADDVLNIQWSSDSSVLLAGSRDCTTRMWPLHKTKNFDSKTLGGSKAPVIGAYFLYTNGGIGSSDRPSGCCTVSENTGVAIWDFEKLGDSDAEDKSSGSEDDGQDDGNDGQAIGGDAVAFFTGGHVPSQQANKRRKLNQYRSQAHALADSIYSFNQVYFLIPNGAGVKATATSYCERGQILAVAFSSGLFGLYEMPTVSNIHTLSVGSNQLVRSCVLNKSGEWLALGCPVSQQLLVWEWRSETYVLKQKGHAYGMRCMAYSPDGVVICTGGEDGKLKLWNATSGFCYVTLEKTHTAPVTAVAFANSSVVLSSSLDGTVRAHDLYRYRTFRTFTTPKPVQFLCLAVDPSGEIVVAGSSDPFHIYAWNMQTGKLLDVYTGHSGPVCSLAFQSNGGAVVSGSWDGTAKIWDLYKGDVPTETLQHSTDVVCVSYRPDGKEICTGTIGGLLSFWDVESAKLKYEIDGRRDISGGRKMNDRMTAQNNASSRYFTSVSYSADGACVLAGGNSRYVCIYEVSQQVLLKKFQITFNRGLDGVLDELNSKNMGDFGPMDDHADSGDEAIKGFDLPGAKRGDDGSRRSKTEVLTRQLAVSSTGREWSVISGEGLHVYSLDEDMIFDPISMTEEMTPETVLRNMSQGKFGLALRMAIHLNEFSLVSQVLEATPYNSIPLIVKGISPSASELEHLLQFIAKMMAHSPHLEFYLQWSLQLLQTHGIHMDRSRGTFMRAFRALYKVIHTRHDELKTICSENKYLLGFLEDHSKHVLVPTIAGAEDTT